VGRFVRGDIVCVPFPISRQEFKRRPALVLGTVPYGRETDYIMCIITTQNTIPDPCMININDIDVENGSLRHASSIRPNYLWTGIESDIHYRIGHLAADKFNQAVNRAVQTINPAPAAPNSF
jgi:mRNA-degrading endonuclease toxin of MazEF toxin-antitoxin module